MATPENDFLPFATGAGANVQSQADFVAADSTENGFISGIAKSTDINKVLRQSSTMAAVIASLIVDKAAASVVDDGGVGTIEANLVLAIQNVAQALNFPVAQITGLQAALNAKLDATANAVSASKLANTFNLDLTGAVTGAVNIDGSQGVSLATTVGSALQASLDGMVAQQIDSGTYGVKHFGISKVVGSGTAMGWTNATDGTSRFFPLSMPGTGYLFATNMTLDTSGNLLVVDSQGNTRTYGTATWVSAQVASEAARAESAESTLTTNLAAEVTRAEAAEASINTTLSTAVQQQIDSGTYGVKHFGISKVVGSGTAMGWTNATDGTSRFFPLSMPGTGYLFATNMTLDTSGNLLAVDSQGNTRTYAPSSYGTISGGYYIRIGNILIQSFTVSVPTGGVDITFPIAFSATPVLVPGYNDANSNQSTVQPTSISATGAHLATYYRPGSNWSVSGGKAQIIVMGPA